MYLLDTDCQSLLDRDTPEARRMTERLLLVRPDEVAVTIVTYEEQMRGWLAWIAQAKTMELQVTGYQRLRRHIERFRVIPVVDFDARAASEFERHRKAGVRIGTMDLKIASIALANQAIVLTRNLRDYSKVPDLVCEDWTISTEEG
jgi:tRNA(fMet)-specific endonuclease VapC